MAPEPETYSELLVAIRHHSLLNPLEYYLFDKVVYCSILYDLAKTQENLDIVNNTIDQASSRLRYLIKPSVEEKAIPEYYEEEHYEKTDLFLLAKYILLGPDHGTVLLDSAEGYEEDSISSSSSFPSSCMEARVGDETWAAWWEGWKAYYTPTKSVSSPPPLQVTWAT